MNLPETLQKAIEKEASRYSLQEVSDAREELTQKYRERAKNRSFMTTEAERCAYLLARLPATYAVIQRVLQEIPLDTVETLLDLGAGPGTAMWAAGDHFSQLKQMTLIENDPLLISLGKRLAQDSPYSNAEWLQQDMEQLKIEIPHDIVILSYSVGELTPSSIPGLIEKCWNLTRQYLVVIEPGTPLGFERIRSIRSQLIAMKAHMVAPCPHALECPMSGGDWCHFSERVERSSLHRRIKKGALGYEDEKFSYLVFSKMPTELPSSRVLRHPQKHSGHISLTLCTDQGLKQEIVSKRTPETYKQARKLDWGDKFERP